MSIEDRMSFRKILDVQFEFLLRGNKCKWVLQRLFNMFINLA